LAILAAARDCFRGRASLQIEVLALRHQLNVLQRSVNRPKFIKDSRLEAHEIRTMAFVRLNSRDMARKEISLAQEARQAKDQPEDTASLRQEAERMVSGSRR